MVDFLGEIGTLDPWLWRGWAYLASPSYRARRHSKWAANGKLYAFADIVFSLTVMALEVCLLVVIVQMAIGALGGRP
jgi:hypothetical protein